jgi:hypothetical protein
MGRGKAGYVELRNREPLRLGPGDLMELTSARGTLDLRAATGVQPVIEIQMDPGRPFLASGSAVTLSLSGLTIRVRHTTTAGAKSILPPVIQAAGPVRIDRCAFEVIGPRPDGCRALVNDGNDLSVERCWFLGFDEAIRITAYNNTIAEIRQTMIVPESGAGPAAGPWPELRGWPLGIELCRGQDAGAAPKRRLILDHCTIEGAGLLMITGDAGPSPLPAEISHCVVKAKALLAWKRRKPGDRLDVDVRWQGVGNQFQVLEPSWVMTLDAATNPAPLPGVTDLPSWSRFVTREVEPIPTPILYAKEPHQRSDSLRPQDLAIDSPEPTAGRAGADPDHVGPWGR